MRNRGDGISVPRLSLAFDWKVQDQEPNPDGAWNAPSRITPKTILVWRCRRLWTASDIASCPCSPTARNQTEMSGRSGNGRGGVGISPGFSSFAGFGRTRSDRGICKSSKSSAEMT